MKKAESYIVAGSRPWNEIEIQKIKSEVEGVVVGVSTPTELEEVVADLTEIRYIFFLHWSDIVPDEITENYECVCFHMTDVPYGRGGSPLQNLIAEGHRFTKLTALRMTNELDAGPVYLKRDLSLEGGSAEEIYMRAGELSSTMVLDIIAGDPVPEPQQGDVKTFKRRTPKQSSLPVELSLKEVHDFIRMLDAEGYPQAFLEVGGLRLEFSRSSLYRGKVKTDVSISLIEEYKSS